MGEISDEMLEDLENRLTERVNKVWTRILCLEMKIDMAQEDAQEAISRVQTLESRMNTWLKNRIDSR